MRDENTKNKKKNGAGKPYLTHVSGTSKQQQTIKPKCFASAWMWGDKGAGEQGAGGEREREKKGREAGSLRGREARAKF